MRTDGLISSLLLCVLFSSFYRMFIRNRPCVCVLFHPDFASVCSVLCSMCSCCVCVCVCDCVAGQIEREHNKAAECR